MDKKKTKKKHVVVPLWTKWIKTNCLALTIYMLTTGFVLAVIYFTVIAQLQQKINDIDMKLAAVGKHNGTKLRESENNERTNLDTHPMCHNGGIWQKFDETNICVCTAGFLGKQCEYSDGKDTSFLVVFHEGAFHPTPIILVASENTAHVSVRYFNKNTNESITFDKSNTEYYLNNSVIPSAGIHLAGVELHSNVKINVYGFLYRSSVSEGFLPLPTRFASTKYIISTLSSSIVMALSPIYQNTAVSINLKLKRGSLTYERKIYNNNDTIRLRLGKYNTFQLSLNSEPSGTLITSSQPVIVVSGNQCDHAVQDNSRKGGCQTFIESLLPTNQLDNLFITPHVATRLNSTVRIQSINSTNLTIKIGDKKTSKMLIARESWDFYYNTISLVYASDDVLVMSYPHGLPKLKGDAFMMTIPGVNQYLYEYDFVVPTGFDSYISITVQSDAIGGFLLDGNPSNMRSVFSISEGLYQFSTFSMSISTGFHHIEHSQNVRFGLWITGNGHIEGYGYLAGMAYKIFD